MTNALGGEDTFDATLNAVIIYDEFERAAKANAMLRHAVKRTDCSAQWNVTPWRVGLLEYPPAAEAALAEAADSHLIVLAALHIPSLLPRLMGWLERWAICRQIEEAALAVWESGSADIHLEQALSELSEFARRHGLSLIFDTGELEDHKFSSAAGDLHKHEVSLTPRLDHVLDQPRRGDYQHWGINE